MTAKRSGSIGGNSTARGVSASPAAQNSATTRVVQASGLPFGEDDRGTEAGRRPAPHQTASAISAPIVKRGFTSTGASANPAMNEISGSAAGMRFGKHAEEELRAGLWESRLAWEEEFTSAAA